MISIIIPAKNEAQGLRKLLPNLIKKHPDAEIIVVNDGSTDDTPSICKNYNVRIVTHPYSKGNGAAVKTGANAASGGTLVFMDADGQHSADHVNQILDVYEQGFHMVVGARKFKSQASIPRWFANSVYNILSSWMVGHTIEDLTSGLRVANSVKFREFLHLLPNGFSYPTTITMAFFRAGYSVGYVNTDVGKRLNAEKGHISFSKDGIRFLLIIFKIGTLYSPLKIFFPLSLLHLVAAVGLYWYTYAQFGRFTNMSAVLFTTAVIIFLIGLLSEQITALVYKPK